MKVRDYVRTLGVLEAKRAEFENLIAGSIGVHTMAILQREIENAITDILALEGLELEPKPQIVRIGLVDNVPMLEEGETFTLAINYTLSDGSLKGFGLEPKANVVIADVDTVYNNVGYITSIEANEYSGLFDMSLKITRTANGFDVFDDNETQGLHIVEEDGVFTLVDTQGESLGVNFTEEGTVAGDDFRVLIIRNTERLAITSNDVSVVTVEGTTVTAVAAGATQLHIEGDGVSTLVNVEVTAIEPVIPQEPEEVEPEPTEPEPTDGEGEGEPIEVIPPTNGNSEQPTDGEDDGEPVEPSDEPVEGEQPVEEPTEDPVDSEPTEEPTEGDNDPVEEEPTEEEPTVEEPVEGETEPVTEPTEEELETP